MVAAEEWGVPPWEIAGGKDRLKWFFRWAAWKEQRGKKQRLVNAKRS